MMIVGGAIMPAIQGALMDVESIGVRGSLGIVLIGYLYLALFGFLRAKHSHESDEASAGVNAGH